MECEDALYDDDLRPVDVRVMLGAEPRVRDEVVRRHGDGLIACALQLVDHREQVVEVELTEDETESVVGRGRGSAGLQIGGFWVKMVAVADGIRMVEIKVACMRTVALGVREVSVEAVHGDGNHRLVPQRFDDFVHHAGLP